MWLGWVHVDVAASLKYEGPLDPCAIERAICPGAGTQQPGSFYEGKIQ